MNKFDQEELICPTCGHRWILMSDKEITEEQHFNWVTKSIEHHALIKKEQEE